MSVCVRAHVVAILVQSRRWETKPCQATVGSKNQLNPLVPKWGAPHRFHIKCGPTRILLWKIHTHFIMPLEGMTKHKFHTLLLSCFPFLFSKRKRMSYQHRKNSGCSGNNS